MLIVEGADCVGKSTFCARAEQLARGYGLPCITSHFGMLPDWWDYYYDYLPHIRPYTIQDRFHISEVAYGTIMRGHSRVTERHARLIGARLSEVGAFTVVLTQPEKVIRERWRDGEEFKLERVLKVNTYYQLLGDCNANRFYGIDRTISEWDDSSLSEVVRDWVNRVRSVAEILREASHFRSIRSGPWATQQV